MAVAATVQARKCARNSETTNATPTRADWAMAVRIAASSIASDPPGDCQSHNLVRMTICADCDPSDKVGCESGLFCGKDNCGKFHKISSSTGFSSTSDCCEGKFCHNQVSGNMSSFHRYFHHLVVNFLTSLVSQYFSCAAANIHPPNPGPGGNTEFLWVANDARTHTHIVSETFENSLESSYFTHMSQTSIHIISSSVCTCRWKVPR